MQSDMPNSEMKILHDEIAKLIAVGGTISHATVDFNSDRDFRDVTVSQGWWPHDFETVAIHEIEHVVGIHEHSTISGSSMQSTISTNYADRTLNSHDRSTIRGMY